MYVTQVDKTILLCIASGGDDQLDVCRKKDNATPLFNQFDLSKWAYATSALT